MFNYILRRLLLLPLVILGVTFLLFFLTQRLSPEMRASLYIKDPRQMGSLEEVIQKYGLRDNVFKQYGRWLGNALKGDLGYSQSANMPVSQAIKAYLPATVQLAVVTIILVVFFGVWFGCVSAVKRIMAGRGRTVVFRGGLFITDFCVGLVITHALLRQARLVCPRRLLRLYGCGGS